MARSSEQPMAIEDSAGEVDRSPITPSPVSAAENASAEAVKEQVPTSVMLFHALAALRPGVQSMPCSACCGCGCDCGVQLLTWLLDGWNQSTWMFG